MDRQNYVLKDRLLRVGRECMPQHEDWAAHAQRPEGERFGGPHDGEAIDAGSFQRGSQSGDAVAIGVGFHDGDQFDARPERSPQRPHIVFGRGEVDFEPGVPFAGDIREPARGRGLE